MAPAKATDGAVGLHQVIQAQSHPISFMLFTIYS